MSALEFGAPGKLVLAGEYGVVLGAPALVAAVDRRVRVTAEASDRWTFSAGLGLPGQPIELASRFVRACFDQVSRLGGSLDPHAIVADSSALSGVHGKFGLGSSAAVSAALVAALLELAGRSEPELVYQLALAAHRQAQGGGSGVDVAASTYGGLLLYFPPHEPGEPGTPWPGFRAQPIRVPEGWRLAVAWSGESASTQGLIDRVLEYFESHPDRRYAFVKASEIYVKELAVGLQNADWHRVAAALRLNRRLLSGLGDEAGVDIETPALREISDRAEACDAAAKLSGAGGGDCAVTVAPAEIAKEIEAAWSAAGFECLDLAVDPTGAGPGASSR